MMEKLLHERLREWTKDNCSAPVSIIALKDACNEAAIDAFTMFLDEIERCYIPKEQHEREMMKLSEAQSMSAHKTMYEWAKHHGMTWENGETITEWIDRYYIPRPRFEDGEPVQFGDEVIGEWVGWSENGETINEMIGEVHTFIYHENKRFELCIADEDGDSYGIRASEDDDCFKRPQPKVLDADGVEIKVGDTVWFVSNKDYEGIPFEVDSLGSGVGLIAGYKGRNIHLGCNSGTAKPEYLTHKEPDSLEKLRDDMEYAIDAWVDGDEEFDWPSTKKWASRLSALIERGA